MLYNDETNKSGIMQEVDSVCTTTSTSYPLVDKNRRGNSALDDYFSIAMKSGNWSVSDKNNTDLEISETNLVSGQADYSFPNELLILEKIRIKKSDGTYKEVTPIDTLPTNIENGEPTSYKKIGNSFIFDKKPDYNSTNGIEVTYRRAFIYATVTGTAFVPTTPGIPSIHHTWLAHKISLPYLMEKGKSNMNNIFNVIQIENKSIEDYFGEKPRDVKGRLTPKLESNR